MQYVTIGHVTAMAQSALGKEGIPPHRYVEWAYDAEISIGPSWNNNRNAILPIEEDGTVEKPDGYVNGLEFALAKFPDAPQPCPDTTQSLLAGSIPPNCHLVYPIYRGRTVFAFAHTGSKNRQIGRDNSGANFGGITFSEDDKKFYVDNLAATGLNAAFVAFQGTPIDEDGDIKIPESHARAVAAYIEWMELKRMRRQNVGQTVYPTEVESAKNTWLQLKMSAYGRDKMPNAIEMREIAVQSVSMIKALSRSRNFDYRSNHKRF